MSSALVLIVVRIAMGQGLIRAFIAKRGVVQPKLESPSSLFSMVIDVAQPCLELLVFALPRGKLMAFDYPDGNETVDNKIEHSRDDDLPRIARQLPTHPVDRQEGDPVIQPVAEDL